MALAAKLYECRGGTARKCNAIGYPEPEPGVLGGPTAAIVNEVLRMHVWILYGSVGTFGSGLMYPIKLHAVYI